MKKEFLLTLLVGLVALPTLPVQADVALAPIPPELLAQGANAKLRTTDRGGSGFTQAVGDFDGDGQADFAELKLQAPEQTRYALVVTLSSAGRKKRVLESGADVQSVGIKTIKPGTYQTACGNGAGPAAAACTTQITIAHDGISLFTFESADSLLYLDGEQFNRVWLTD